MCSPRGAEGAVVRNKAGAGELRWGGFGIGADGGSGVDSAHNKWQFSVWSGWLPSTGLDCRGLLGGLWGKAGEEDE